MKVSTPTRSKRLAAIAGLALATLPGCAWYELQRAQEARRDYEECMAENPREPERCDVLRTEMNRRYDTYEKTAEDKARNWRDEGDWAK